MEGGTLFMMTWNLESATSSLGSLELSILTILVEIRFSVTIDQTFCIVRQRFLFSFA